MSVECGCWRNPETGYLEACENHDPVFMEYAMTIQDLSKELTEAQAQVKTLEHALNTPELHDFAAGVVSEAQHQRMRWGSSHDSGKEPQDWFWLLGYLAGKALAAHAAGNTEKALHHTISSAAAMANWHASILGATDMRPGIDPVERGIEQALAAKE